MRPTVELRHAYFPHDLQFAYHRDGPDVVKMEAFRLASWVQMTHETKGEVMRRVSRDDLAAVGCENPDIYVVSRRDDRIVLVPPRTLRSTRGKGRKVVTSIQAQDIFEDEWRERIPTLKLLTLSDTLHDLAIDSADISCLARDPSSYLVAVKERPRHWVAYIFYPPA